MCYLYDLFLYLGSGFFFGDSALEGKGITRNATIRAEEDTILGFLTSDDYLNIIAPQRKIEKMKEINFLMHNFFFKDIKTSFFEQNLFHFFTLNENKRGSVLFTCDSKPNYLFFLKEGNISLTLDASIIDINILNKELLYFAFSKYL
jgi:CRP-like cAMP-binding protein